MLWKQTLIPTTRDIPKEAEATSHKLLLRAGYIKKLSAGVYSYLPLGFRVLQKISDIIREEMFRAGASELLLPALHPSELWKKTGRFDALGEDKISFINRSGQEFVLGPTHEEVITDLVASYVQSYQNLPLSLYQIQTKFRDELRPRFGVVRTKEFIMKDAYSFHRDEADLKKTYEKFYSAYEKIMARCGLEIHIVAADSGIMGGKVSHEFMVACPYGEDRIVICSKCKTSVSRDVAARDISAKPKQTDVPEKVITPFDTPDLKTITDLSNRFDIKPAKMIKTILYSADDQLVAVCVPGSEDINESKLKKTLGVQKLRIATPDEILKATGAPLGFSGPVKLQIKIIVDFDILSMKNFVAGANEKDKHFWNVNIGRDFKPDVIADIRYAKEGDQCPRCHSTYQFLTAMEMGHTFQLGTRYSEALSCSYRDENGEVKPVVMGCYGIGVTRIVAAAIEQHSDEKGIMWPISIAPYQVLIVTLNENDAATQTEAVIAYETLLKHQIDVLYDNRDERAGVKFNDADLIGIPIQIIVSERNLTQGKLEIKTRHDKKSILVDKNNFLITVQEIIRSLSAS